MAKPPTSHMENSSRPATVHVQSVGRVPAVEAQHLTPGDKVMWNFGQVNEVIAIEVASPQFMRVTLTSDNTDAPSRSVRRMKKTRLVAVASARALSAKAAPPAGAPVAPGAAQPAEKSEAPAPWLVIEEQVWAAMKALDERAVRSDVEARTLGPYRVFAHLGYRADGTEFLKGAHLANPHNCMVAGLAPLDADGTLWRHRTTYGGTVEVTTHASLMDAAHAAANEAAQRGAWAAIETEDVEAAYAAHPRPVLCEACGR